MTDQLGVVLGPVMELVGLPGSMGLVWATAMITNLYGGLVVFASLAPDAGLTVAQVTTLCSMMLVAHGLPVELRIAQKAGPRLRAMAMLRFGGAFLLGWLLYLTYSLTGSLQSPNTTFWVPPRQDPSWIAWGIGEIRNMLLIFIIILSLLLVMRLLERAGIVNLLTKLLEPVLSLMGMCKGTAPITIIGMTLGLSYGGGLIIQEARAGKLTKQDVFFSLGFMGLCHGIIEDTLLMMVLGAHLSGILWGRLLFSLLLVALLVKVMRSLPDKTFNRYLFRASI
jgi:spore maturation protein SpmB